MQASAIRDLKESGIGITNLIGLRRVGRIDANVMPWKTFHSLGSLPVFGAESASEASACCVPEAPVAFAPRSRSNARCG